MIPKIIHYCWFGGNPLNELSIKCIESWKKYCPDYQIIEWNESNFDINCNDYVREAYEAKKWAFVTDYVRLKIVFEHGGLYFDTDVEVVKPIDTIVENTSAFFAMESAGVVATGLGFGAEKGAPILQRLMSDYDGIHFNLDDVSFDNTPCPVRNAKAFLEIGLKKEDSLQEINNITFYPHEYFNPTDFETGHVELTENTYTIHHFSASWYSEEEKKSLTEWNYRREMLWRYRKKYGKTVGNIVHRVWLFIRKRKFDIANGGIRVVFRKVINKFRTWN